MYKYQIVVFKNGWYGFNRQSLFDRLLGREGEYQALYGGRWFREDNKGFIFCQMPLETARQNFFAELWRRPPAEIVSHLFNMKFDRDKRCD